MLDTEDDTAFPKLLADQPPPELQLGCSCSLGPLPRDERGAPPPSDQGFSTHVAPPPSVASQASPQAFANSRTRKM